MPKTYTPPETFLVFDVESIGLHGEGFAVGYVVVDRAGRELESGLMAANPNIALGANEDHLWVAANVPAMDYTFKSPKEVREAFWAVWERWRDTAVLVADCAWPVEARFLQRCVDQDYPHRNWRGPYPLHDLASVLLAKGIDPLAINQRLAPLELPAHNPLADARQSARQLVTALAI